MTTIRTCIFINFVLCITLVSCINKRKSYSGLYRVYRCTYKGGSSCSSIKHDYLSLKGDSFELSLLNKKYNGYWEHYETGDYSIIDLHLDREYECSAGEKEGVQYITVLTPSVLAKNDSLNL